MSEVAMPGERTVLKGLIGHGSSSGDQVPWECDEEGAISRAESASRFITPYRQTSPSSFTLRPVSAERPCASMFVTPCWQRNISVCASYISSRARASEYINVIYCFYRRKEIKLRKKSYFIFDKYFSREINYLKCIIYMILFVERVL